MIHARRATFGIVESQRAPSPQWCSWSHVAVAAGVLRVRRLSAIVQTLGCVPDHPEPTSGRQGQERVHVGSDPCVATGQQHGRGEPNGHVRCRDPGCRLDLGKDGAPPRGARRWQETKVKVGQIIAWLGPRPGAATGRRGKPDGKARCREQDPEAPSIGLPDGLDPVTERSVPGDPSPPGPPLSDRIRSRRTTVRTVGCYHPLVCQIRPAQSCGGHALHSRV